MTIHVMMSISLYLAADLAQGRSVAADMREAFDRTSSSPHVRDITAMDAGVNQPASGITIMAHIDGIFDFSPCL